MKKKILLGSRFEREGFSELEKEFELIYPPGKSFSRKEVLERIGEVAVWVPGVKTDREIIEAGKELMLIANYGVGYDNIDVEYATQKGITVTNTPHSVLEPTAELCFALLMATARRISYYDRKLRMPEGLDWSMYGDLGTGLYGKTLGIFGMGRIGQAVARRAVAGGMRILYYNRKQLPEEIEKIYKAEYVPFDRLLKQADFLSLHAPASEDTQHLINTDTLGRMKKTAILINTSRGTVVDEKALVHALKSGIIAGAGLDVYENEPHISAGLKSLDNVVLTPHAGTKTREARREMQEEVARNILGFFHNTEISKVR
ncbi:MAG: NAD(P)-binding domain-containing protein [Candidatus Azobacteroides sp.]|nr:NAD(P)-binding domain-containing protein [Candidatus Azobacteroides sp.]